MQGMYPRTMERPANDAQAWASRNQSGGTVGRAIAMLALVVVVFAAGVGAAAFFFWDKGASEFVKPGVKVETIRAGSGASPTRSDVILANYKGTLPDGSVFDQMNQAVLPLDSMIPGFSEAMFQTQRGGKYKLLIPAHLAYGSAGMGPIPPNTDLTFEIEVIDFKNRAEIDQAAQAMQPQQTTDLAQQATSQAQQAMKEAEQELLKAQEEINKAVGSAAKAAR